MTAKAERHSAGDGEERSRAVSAGRVGRPHGLDGSFYVTAARPRLLVLGGAITLAGHSARVLRRAGTDAHPIVRVEGIDDRGATEALRGLELMVELDEAPALEDGEWWASELEGCAVFDGERHVGEVIGLLELPSCEALEVRPAISDARRPAGSSGGSRGELLVPMVRAAIRQVDVARRRIEVDMSFLEDAL